MVDRRWIKNTEEQRCFVSRKEMNGGEGWELPFFRAKGGSRPVLTVHRLVDLIVLLSCPIVGMGVGEYGFGIR
jgi:hypothetical protein